MIPGPDVAIFEFGCPAREISLPPPFVRRLVVRHERILVKETGRFRVDILCDERRGLPATTLGSSLGLGGLFTAQRFLAGHEEKINFLAGGIPGRRRRSGSRGSPRRAPSTPHEQPLATHERRRGSATGA
jgi:hypothetical protein